MVGWSRVLALGWWTGGWEVDLVGFGQSRDGVAEVLVFHSGEAAEVYAEDAASEG